MICLMILLLESLPQAGVTTVDSDALLAILGTLLNTCHTWYVAEYLVRCEEARKK